MRNIEAGVARGELPPFPGPEGSSNPQLQGYPDWVAMKRFNPVSYLGDLSIPTLIVDAEEESLFDRKKNGLHIYRILKQILSLPYLKKIPAVI